MELLQLLDTSRIGSDYTGNFSGNPGFGPASAFQRQQPNTLPFLATGSLPRTIWYRLSQPAIIGQFGFRNRRDLNGRANDPIDFDFIGSQDCTDWTILMSVKDVKWSGNDEEKQWTISDGKSRRLMIDNDFRCYGIRFLKISGRYMAGIQDMKMWQVVRNVDIGGQSDNSNTSGTAVELNGGQVPVASDGQTPDSNDGSSTEQVGDSSIDGGPGD